MGRPIGRFSTVEISPLPLLSPPSQIQTLRVWMTRIANKTPRVVPAQQSKISPIVEKYYFPVKSNYEKESIYYKKKEDEGNFEGNKDIGGARPSQIFPVLRMTRDSVVSRCTTNM